MAILARCFLSNLTYSTQILFLGPLFCIETERLRAGVPEHSNPPEFVETDDFIRLHSGESPRFFFLLFEQPHLLLRFVYLCDHLGNLGLFLRREPFLLNPQSLEEHGLGTQDFSDVFNFFLSFFDGCFCSPDRVADALVDLLLQLKNSIG